jgi:hypothetical protein
MTGTLGEETLLHPDFRGRSVLLVDTQEWPELGFGSRVSPALSALA